MAYNPTNWKDRAVEHPRTYTLQDNPDGTVTLIPVPGTVYEPGTPVSAGNMNKIEQGIASALPIDGSVAMTGTLHSQKNITADGYLAGEGITNKSGYFTMDSYNDATYGQGLARLHYRPNTRMLMWDARDGASNPVDLADMFLSGNKVWHAGNINPVSKAGDTMTGRLVAPSVDVTGNGADNLRLVGTDHVYIPFFPQGFSGGRKAYVGYSNANVPTFSIQNEVTNGDINLGTIGTGSVKANGNRVWDASTLRVNNGVLEFWTGGAWQPVGGIKNVQRGVSQINIGSGNTNNYADISISAVTLSKSQLNLLTNFSVDSNTSGVTYKVFSARLLNSNTIRISWLPGNSQGTQNVDVSWEVIESY